MIDTVLAKACINIHQLRDTSQLLVWLNTREVLELRKCKRTEARIAPMTPHFPLNSCIQGKVMIFLGGPTPRSLPAPQ